MEESELELDLMNKKDKTPSELDNQNFLEIRKSVLIGVTELAAQLANLKSNQLVGLEIAPQDHNILGPILELVHKLYTMDINPLSKPDFVGDICEFNDAIRDSQFDFIICTEVIEHVSNPQKAIDELMRMTKVGGYLLLTSPFNFRIHGPLPDNWRISEWGWKTLLARHKIVSLRAVESSDRELFPIHYRVIAQRV